MRYYVVHIQTCFAESWQADIFNQQLCDLGVDTIDIDESQAGNVLAHCYIQSCLWEQNADEIKALCAATEGVTLVHTEACPDENWNAVWESEHPIQELPLGIRIVPHCAFGAGHHETTSMMIDSLVAADLSGKKVLDHGTGTGVLAIFAKRLGAAEVLAIDIDDKSVVNAQENAALNGEQIIVALGTTVPFADKTGRNYMSFDLILANIHRNVLLANIAAYAAGLNQGGELWLSGFYQDDCPVLIAAAQAEGLHYQTTRTNGEWCMLRFCKA